MPYLDLPGTARHLPTQVVLCTEYCVDRSPEGCRCARCFRAGIDPSARNKPGALVPPRRRLVSFPNQTNFLYISLVLDVLGLSFPVSSLEP